MMLYQAAQVMLVRSTKWSWLKAWAMKSARHRGVKKTIVALAARRLAKQSCHRIWVDGAEFSGWAREAAAALTIVQDQMQWEETQSSTQRWNGVPRRDDG